MLIFIKEEAVISSDESEIRCYTRTVSAPYLSNPDQLIIVHEMESDRLCYPLAL